MLEGFEAIKAQLNKLWEGDISEQRYLMQLGTFVSSCVEFTHGISGNVSSATYTPVSKLTATQLPKTEGSLLSLKRRLDVMGDIINELSRIHSDSSNRVEEKLNHISRQNI